MKKCIYFVSMLFIFLACEDVIEVDTPTEGPRLIIDALIKIDTTQPIQTARVRVALTDSFFGKIPVTALEQITITNIDMESTFANPNFIVLLEVAPGVYEKPKNTAFFTQGELIFQLRHEDRLYLARTRYAPAVPIDSLEQGDNTLFDENDTEVIVTFTDAPDRDDFYVFDFDFGEYLATEDEFYQGQEFKFSFFYDQNLEAGREISISLLGVDQAFFNYMNLLIDQSSDDFNVFDTPVATVRGNISDVTDIDNIDFFDNVDQPDNFPLGYFAVVQEFKQTLVIR